MNKKEIEIRFSDLCAMLLKAFKPILCFALILALLGGGFGLYKAMNAEKSATITEDDVKKAENAVKSAENKLSSARKALERRNEIEIPDAQRKIKRAQKLLQRRQEYIDNSLYYALDPFNVGISRLTFYIETDEEVNPNLPWLGKDPQASIAIAYAQIYSLDNEILNNIRQIMGTDADIPYIKEMISVTNVSNQFVEILARNQNAEIAEKIVDYLYSTLLNRLRGSVGDFSANVISRFSGYEVDWSMNDSHTNNEENLISAERSLTDAEENLQTLIDGIEEKEEDIANAEDALAEAKKDLADVRAQYEDSTVNAKNMIKKTSRYLVIGLVLGVVLACFAALFNGIAGSRLQNQSSVLSRYSFPVLGILPVEKKHAFAKTIRKLEGDPETKREPAARVAAQNVMELAAGKKVCLVSSLGDKATDVLNPYLEGKLPVCGDILRDSAAAKALTGFDGIVLVETRGQSSIDQIDGEVQLANTLGKEILGIVLL